LLGLVGGNKPLKKTCTHAQLESIRGYCPEQDEKYPLVIYRGHANRKSVIDMIYQKGIFMNFALPGKMTRITRG
jgi:hypothetical protein